MCCNLLLLLLVFLLLLYLCVAATCCVYVLPLCATAFSGAKNAGGGLRLISGTTALQNATVFADNEISESKLHGGNGANVSPQGGRIYYRFPVPAGMRPKPVVPRDGTIQTPVQIIASITQVGVMNALISACGDVRAFVCRSATTISPSPCASESRVPGHLTGRCVAIVCASGTLLCGYRLLAAKCELSCLPRGLLAAAVV